MNKLSIALGVLLLFSAAVVAQKFPDYPVKRAAEYRTCQTQNGIRVMPEPLSNSVVLLIPSAPILDSDKDLREAAKKCDVAKVHRSLAQGANVNAADDKGMTGLMLAAEKGCGKVVIPKGALGWGRVTDAKDTGYVGHNAELDFVIESVTAIDGQNIPVRSTTDKDSGGGASGRRLALGYAAGVFLEFLFRKASKSAFAPAQASSSLSMATKT